MSAIEALIKVKKQAKNDDLIRLLDEVITYEKLNKMKTFENLRTSKAAQKKVPLLSSAYQGDMYALSMVTMAGHILRHLDDNIPLILTELEEQITEKEQQRLLIMQDALIQPQYWPLHEYKHDKMRNHVVAMFSNERADKTAILIVAKESGTYHIYQGYYKAKKTSVVSKALEPYCVKHDNMSLSILTYSIQGNNAYPFGVFHKNKKRYDVMLPSHDSMWLREVQTGELFTISLSMEQRNRLNMAKAQVESFADILLQIIQEGGI